MHLRQRWSPLPPYLSAVYTRKLAALGAAGTDVITPSRGDPDLPPPPQVIDRLCETAREPNNQRYPEYAGMPEFRTAIALWLQRRFGVEVDPGREVLPLIGSKEGLAPLPLPVMDPVARPVLPDPAHP